MYKVVVKGKDNINDGGDKRLNILTEMFISSKTWLKHSFEIDQWKVTSFKEKSSAIWSWNSAKVSERLHFLPDTARQIDTELCCDCYHNILNT